VAEGGKNFWLASARLALRSWLGFLDCGISRHILFPRQRGKTVSLAYRCRRRYLFGMLFYCVEKAQKIGRGNERSCN
jgi:hypothetical protein